MRWKCTCAYDGTDFYGWQSQVGGNTVQDFVESRLEQLFKKPIRIHGSGRTDSGVHAKGQVFHFDADWKHGTEKLLRAFRSGLPAGIQVSKVQAIDDAFHARFSAVGKRYAYHLFQGFAPPHEARYYWSLGNRKLNVAAMNDAASRLIGEHDFTGFGANRGDGSEDNPVKDMRRLEISARGPRLRLVTEASGYLYKMVRSLTGTLVEVGLGNLSVDDVEAVLVEKRRIQKVNTAPPQGLFMEKVFYK